MKGDGGRGTLPSCFVRLKECSTPPRPHVPGSHDDSSASGSDRERCVLRSIRRAVAPTAAADGLFFLFKEAQTVTAGRSSFFHFLFHSISSFLPFLPCTRYLGRGKRKNKRPTNMGVRGRSFCFTHAIRYLFSFFLQLEPTGSQHIGLDLLPLGCIVYS